jgi:hypothetical protein
MGSAAAYADRIVAALEANDHARQYYFRRDGGWIALAHDFGYGLGDFRITLDDSALYADLLYSMVLEHAQVTRQDWRAQVQKGLERRVDMYSYKPE